MLGSMPALRSTTGCSVRKISLFTKKSMHHVPSRRIHRSAEDPKSVVPDTPNPETKPVSGGGAGGSSGGGSSGGSGPDGEGEEGARLPPATVFLALLLLAGGLMGYKQSGSKKSAIAGGGGGAVLILSALLMRGPTPALGFCLACGTTMALGVVMVKRYAQTRKFMPAGLIASLSVLYSILYLTSGRMA